MELQAKIGEIAGILSLAAFLPYWWAILRRKTRPNRATWLIWLVVGMAIASSYRASGASYTIWVPISYTIGPLVTSIVGIKYGEGGWTKFDRSCLLLSLISLIPWLLLRSPGITLLVNIFVDLLGAMPTIRKSYLHPDGEDLGSWVMFTIANGMNILAIDRWSWEIALYPLYLFTTCMIICGLLTIGRFYPQ
jgi:hypothetical protein